MCIRVPKLYFQLAITSRLLRNDMVTVIFLACHYLEILSNDKITDVFSACHSLEIHDYIIVWAQIISDRGSDQARPSAFSEALWADAVGRGVGLTEYYLGKE